ncbi:hypothetical protein [Microbacterium sp.]|uniref:hypothetical protein n=1 Tax=Microbacterium sp. TaxID=51671 RepID=UPI00260F37A3|nr:hypothetical protein [Microbacterium sp.]
MKNITKVGVATLAAFGLVVAGTTAAQAATFAPEGDGSGTTITTSHNYTTKFPIGAQAPAGLSVAAGTGVVSGTPVADGSFYVWSGSTLAAADKVYGLNTSAQVSGSATDKFAPLTPSATTLGASGYTESYAFISTPENLNQGVNGWAAYTAGPSSAAPAATNVGMSNLGGSGSNSGGVAALFAGTGTKTAYVGVALTSNSGVVPVVTWARQITINADTDTYTFAADQIIIAAPPTTPDLATVQAVVTGGNGKTNTAEGTVVTVDGLAAASTYKPYVYTTGGAKIPLSNVTANGSGQAVVDVASALAGGLAYGQDAYLVFVQPGDISQLEGVSLINISSATAGSVDVTANVTATNNFQLTTPSTGVDFGDVARDTTATAALGGFTVIDDRNTLTGWSVNVSANDFTGPSGATISKDQLGYVATVVGGNSAGSAPTTGKTAGAGAFGSALAATTGNGTAASGANYDLNLSFLAPVSATAGSYTSSVTLTLVPAS